MVYKISGFRTYNEAERARIIVRENGYPDALINKVVRSVPYAYTSPAPIPFASPSVSSIVYKVQLGVFQNPDNVAFNSGLKSFGYIQQSTNNKGLTVFSLGDFYNMSEATKAQENAINLGVAQAFVVKYRDGVRID